MTWMLRVFDKDATFVRHLDHVAAFNGGEGCIHDGEDGIHHSLQPLTLLCIGIAILGHDAVRSFFTMHLQKFIKSI